MCLRGWNQISPMLFFVGLGLNFNLGVEERRFQQRQRQRQPPIRIQTAHVKENQQVTSAFIQACVCLPNWHWNVVRLAVEQQQQPLKLLTTTAQRLQPFRYQRIQVWRIDCRCRIKAWTLSAAEAEVLVAAAAAAVAVAAEAAAAAGISRYIDAELSKLGSEPLPVLQGGEQEWGTIPCMPHGGIDIDLYRLL